MHSASISSNKLSNLLKSRSSSVSVDGTRPLLRSGDLYTGLQKSSPVRSINNANRQTSRALAWREKSYTSRDDHSYKCDVESRSRLMRLLLLFVLFSICTRSFFLFSIACQCNACAINYVQRVKNYLIIADIYAIHSKHVETNVFFQSKKAANTYVICKRCRFQVFYKRYVNCYFRSSIKIVYLMKFLSSFFFLRMIVLCANCAMNFSNFAISTYVYKELMFLDSGILLLLHITSCIFISIYRRHTRAPCLRTSIRTKYFAKLSLKCTDGFLCVWRKKRSFSSAREGAIQSDIDEADELPITQCALINWSDFQPPFPPFGVEPR